MSAGFRRVAFELRGGIMAGIAFGSEKLAPDLVFLHATGFNAHAYRATLEPLGERWSVLALDLRGHGRTLLATDQWFYPSWRIHRDDVIGALDLHVKAPVVLAGHSLGGTVSALIAAKRPDLVSALALIDPVILARRRLMAMEAPFAPWFLRRNFSLARGAARRRDRFVSREAAVEALVGRGVFKRFPREAIADYIADGFIADGQGGVRLACSPAYEAATFAAHRNRTWAALRAVSCPVVLRFAEQRSTTAPEAARFLAARGGDVEIVAGAGHMLPMEAPDVVRAALERALAAAGAA